MSYEDAKQRALPYLAPIPGASPAGTSAKADPRYEAVLKEIAKLDSPVGGAVDWGAVSAHGGEILTAASKDLAIAAYVAYALSAAQGLAGLATGCALLAELMEAFWGELFPEVKRMRGRVNALSWFFDRAAVFIGAAKVTPAGRPALDDLEAGAQRLADVARARMEAQAPSPRALFAAVERLRLAQPAAPATKAPAVSDAVAPRATPVAPAALDSPAIPAPPSDLADPTDFLRAAGNSLAQGARQLESANPADPAGYRVFRVGLWLHLRAAPPADADKRTRVPPLNADLHSRLEAMSAGARWLELLDESESALSQSRLALDLQRFTAEALRGLGESHKAAREAVVLELRALLQRMPGLPALRFSDGSPVADAATASWIDSEVLAAPTRAASAPAPSTPSAAVAPGDDTGAYDEARKLAGSGGLAQAVAFLQAAVGRSPSGAGRFRLRLQMARLLADGGQLAGARVLYEALEAEAAERALDAWDPALAAECVAGAMACADKNDKSAGEGARRRRFAMLDPVAALKLAR